MEYSKTVHVSLFCRIFGIVCINMFSYIPLKVVNFLVRMNKVPRKAGKCLSFSRLLVSDGKTSSLIPLLNELGPFSMSQERVRSKKWRFARFIRLVMNMTDLPLWYLPIESLALEELSAERDECVAASCLSDAQPSPKSEDNFNLVTDLRGNWKGKWWCCLPF